MKKSFKIVNSNGVESGVELDIIGNRVCISKHDKFKVEIYEDEVESFLLALQEVNKYFLIE